MKNRKLSTLVIHGTESLLYTKKIYRAPYIRQYEHIKYGPQWIIKQRIRFTKRYVHFHLQLNDEHFLTITLHFNEFPSTSSA